MAEEHVERRLVAVLAAIDQDDNLVRSNGACTYSLLELTR